MNSLSFNKAHNISAQNQKVSFTGQKSIIDAAGDGIYRFYAPPYDDSKYLIALELVSVDNKTDAKGRQTADLATKGKPVLLNKSVEWFKGASNVFKNASFDVSEKELKKYQIDKDLVGYRFVLLDKQTYSETKNIEKAIEAAKWTDGNKHKHTRYLLDSGHTASSGPFEDYSYFSKKQGFVNKTGPMYHIFPDSYNVEDGNEDFVRSPFNKAGGNIQGMIEKLREKNSELSPYEMIITTPLFGGDDVSSHGYWTANPFQVASTKGTLEDFKELQTAMFDAGKTYVTDGAFTSFGLQSPQLHHVLKWGKASPFYHWMKLDDKDSPNLKIQLGVFPDTIAPQKDAAPEDYKKAQAMLDSVRFKVVNPKYIESNPDDRFSSRKLNPDYDDTKPTYIQLYDSRLAGAEADNISELITFYENQTPENHYDIATHQDSVQPFYFEVDPKDARFQTRGASLRQLQEEGYVSDFDKLKKPVVKKGYNSYFEMPHFTITTKSAAGGANTWDGQVDLFKANISGTTNNPANKLGNRQVKSYYYNIAAYWTKLTDDALIEHIANNIGKKGDAALNNIAKQHRLSPAEINNLSYVIETPEFEENFNKKFEGKSGEKILLDAIVNFPLESIEFAPDLTAVLSMPEITPRPSGKNTNEKATKTELLETMPQKAQNLYKDAMFRYVTSILNKLDAKMPAGQKIFENGNLNRFTEYGKFVSDIIVSDIMKYGVTKALFPDDDLVEFDKEGRAEYDESLKYKGLISLGINEPNKPENDANVLLKQLIEGFDDIQKEDNSDLVNALYTRFKDIDFEGIKMARAIVNQTGAGLNWRFDAAKDVADLDKRRSNNSQVKFEDCWDDAIDFWGGFIQNIRKYNPAAYTIAEVTNLWEFSRWQYSNKNAVALKNIRNLETLSDPQQKHVLYEFYMANKDRLGTGNISEDVRRSLASKKITAKELEKNPSLITDREYRELRTYFGLHKDKGARQLQIDGNRAFDAMQFEDFGKYINPDIAERMLYEKTGATTGSNYDTFFGLYPELFGQNFEHGKSDKSEGRLHNLAAFEDGLKGFFSKNTPQFINHSHIFVNNHDKPRPLHCMALDMELFLSDLKNYDSNPEVRQKKTAEYTNRAKAVTKISKESELDTVSSMAVAVGERYLKMFESSYKGILSEAELNTVKQAIADLACGKYLNHENGSMERSRTFGYLPFDITLQDVIFQARYLAESKGMKWSISEGKKTNDKTLSKKEEELFNATFSKLAPDTKKLSAMLRMMMFSVGIPTLFAGDEMAHTGYETPTKNVELAIRNIVHHSWIDDGDKDFIRELYNHTMAAANVHKMKGLSALADGSPLIVPQHKDEEAAAHTALFKYNNKGSNVLVVYSDKQMDNNGEDFTQKARNNLKTGEIDKVSHIDLGYLDAHGNQSGNAVAKDGDKYRRLEYNKKTAQYEPKETYIVEKGKLYKAKLLGGKNWVADTSNSEEAKIPLDDVANVFYKEN